MPYNVPPPNVLETELQALASCQYALCQGSGQEPVSAYKTTVEHTYASRGGDIPGVENSQVYLRFANEDDIACVVCGGARTLSEQTRPTYQPLSGHDPLGLVNGTVARYDPNVVNGPDDERVAALEAELRAARQAQEETAAKLEQFMAAFVPADEIEDPQP